MKTPATKGQEALNIENGHRATEALNKIKYLMKRGEISYDAAKEFAQPYLDYLNKRGRAIARKHGVSPKKITFTGFMR